MSGEGSEEAREGREGAVLEPILRLLEAAAKTLGWKASVASALSSIVIASATHRALNSHHTHVVIGAAVVTLVVAIGAAVYGKGRLRMLREEIGTAHHLVSHQIRDSLQTLLGSFLASLQSNAEADTRSVARRYGHSDRLDKICGEIKRLFEVLTKSGELEVTLFLTDKAPNEHGREVPVAVLAYSTRAELHAAEESIVESKLPRQHSLEPGRNLPFQYAVHGNKSAKVSYFCVADARKCSCHCDVQAFGNTSRSLLICPVSCRRTGDVVGFIWLDSTKVSTFAREHYTHVAAVADQLYVYFMLLRQPRPKFRQGPITAKSIKSRARDAG